MEHDIEVLHVEDDPNVAELTSISLEREQSQLRVDTAPDADTGLNRLEDHEYDCVVADYDMPGQNGIELLETVRDEYPTLPFILFTGKGSEEVASEAISRGATDYFRKGVGTEQYEILGNRIANAVSRARSQRAERHLRELAEETDQVLYVFSSDWSEVLFVSSAYEDVWERPVEGLRADPRRLVDGIHPEDRAEARAAMDRIADGDTVEFECRVDTDDDSARWVQVHGKPIVDDDGDVTRIAGYMNEITERKRRQKEVKRYQQLVNSLDEPAAVYDPDGRYRALNDALLDLRDGTADELHGERSPHVERIRQERDGTPFQALVSGDRDEISGEHTATFASEEDSVFEYRFTPLVIDDEREGFVGISRDVTDRKAREEQIERQNELFRKAQRMADIGAWEYDPDTDETTWTEQVYRILGVSNPDEAAIASVPERYHPADRQQAREALDRAVGDGQSFEVTVRVRTEDGTTRRVRQEGDPILEDGDVACVRGTFQDITGATRREGELRRKRRLVENLPVGVFRTTTDGDLVSVNDRLLTIYDAESPEQLREVGVRALYLDDSDRDRLLDKLEEQGQVRDELIEVETLDGDRRLVRTTIREASRGDPRYFDGIVHDVTDRHELRNELAQIRTIAESLEEALYVLDAERRFTYVNARFAELLGTSAETITGDTLSAIDDPDLVETIQQQLDTLGSEGTTDTTTRHVRLEPTDRTATSAENTVGTLARADGARVFGILRVT